MNWLQKLAQIIDYPLAGAQVSGLIVRPDVPNTDSIGAGFYEYKVLPGIREVPMREWDATPHGTFYAADDIKQSQELAEEIRQSGEINPLIIAINEKDQWIVEGVHRLVALNLLGAQSFPALVVVDQDPEPSDI